MKFQFTFEIQPSGSFGVPQAGTTVLRSDSSKQLEGDIYHTATMTRVGYGSLPEYRSAQEAVDLPLSMGACQGQLRDNYLFLDTEAENQSEAYTTATEEVGRFLSHLSISRGVLFTYKPLLIETTDGAICPLPQYSSLGSFNVYDLRGLKEAIDQVSKYQALNDQPLQGALRYWSHARFLFEKRLQIADPLSEHYTLLISSIFLNLWKALSAIVGDPSKDSDYQKRYKTLGLSYEFFQSKIERIRELRNDSDVAHYSLNDEDVTAIEATFGEADQTVLELISRYRDLLLSRASGKEDFKGD